MKLSRNTRSFGVALGLPVLVALGAVPAAAAGATVSGTFGSNTVRFPGYVGPMDMDALANGSFSGTFSTDNLPLPANTQRDLTSFSLKLFDSNGNLVHTYSDQDATDFAFVDEFTYNGEQLSTLNFQRYAEGDRSGLQLTFAPGFEGTGTTPSPSRFNGFNGLNASNSDDLAQGWEKISIVSAAAVVPEPATAGLALAAAVAGLVKRQRRA